MQHIPAGCEGEIDVSNQSCTANVVNEFSAERNKDDGAEEASCRQAEVTETVENSFVSTTRSLTFDTAEVSTEMVPTVPKEIGLNIKELLTVYSCGIRSELIPELYKEKYQTTLNLHKMGYCSLEAFLLVLQQSNILHLRYGKPKILVYPAAEETESEPEEVNPFPHITEIDGDPVSSSVTVSRPPPGFTTVSELHKQPLISPTGSAAHGQTNNVPEMPGTSHPQTLLTNLPMANTNLSKSTYVPETQGQSHQLFSLPTLPMANAIQSNFIPQPTNLPMPPVYDVPLLANMSLAAQSPVLQHLMLYENILHQEQLKRYYTFLLSQNIGAASLVNPFMLPELNPPMVYIPTPGSERLTNVGQSELGISEVLSCTMPSQQNASSQILPSGTGQLAAAAYVSAEDSASVPDTFDTQTETKKPASVMSSGVSHLSAVNRSKDLCTANVLCDEQPTTEAIASPKEVKGVSPVKNKQQQSKDELVQKASSNTTLTDFYSGCYQSDDMLVADSLGLESESHDDFESQYVNDATDLSSDSVDVYRSDDEDDDD